MSSVTRLVMIRSVCPPRADRAGPQLVRGQQFIAGPTVPGVRPPRITLHPGIVSTQNPKKGKEKLRRRRPALLFARAAVNDSQRDTTAEDTLFEKGATWFVVAGAVW